MAKRDYYEVLGISKGASADEIKKAYRQLAKKYHPDIYHEPDATERMTEINEAYEVLSDENKRARYDQYGFAGVDPQAGGAGQGGFGGFGGFGSFSEDEVDLGDIFSSFFGGGTRRGPRQSNEPRKGRDVYKELNISFMEAVKGCSKEIVMMVDEQCDECHGTGAKSSSDIQTCSRCRGRGRVITQTQSIFGTIQQESVCPECRGKGKTIKNKCTKCSGGGYIRRRATFDLKIPEGINEGQQLRVEGKGERGVNGGPNGDLIVGIHILEDKVFIRDGSDIYVKVQLDAIDAMLGCKINVPTVNGEVELVINEGTQHNQQYRLKEKGVKDLRSKRYGDQFVIIEIVIPTNLSKEEKELLTKIRDIEDGKPEKKSFWSRIKENMKK